MEYDETFETFEEYCTRRREDRERDRAFDRAFLRSCGIDPDSWVS